MNLFIYGVPFLSFSSFLILDCRGIEKQESCSAADFGACHFGLCLCIPISSANNKCFLKASS